MGDEKDFLAATKEYEAGKIDSGLLAKARALAEGNEESVAGKYIALRVAQKKSERNKRVASAAVDAGKIIAPAVGDFSLWLVKGVLILGAIVILLALLSEKL